MHDGNLTKEKLLDEAAKLIELRGFGATSINDLLSAAGVKRGALYHHFPGKDDVGLAVLQRIKACFFTSVDTALNVLSPREGLERFFTVVLERHRAKGFAGGCIFGNTALEMSDASSRYVEFVRQFFQEWTDKIETVIRAGQENGQIHSDTPARELAEVIISTIEGGIMLSRLKKEERPLRQCLDAVRKMLGINE